LPTDPTIRERGETSFSPSGSPPTWSTRSSSGGKLDLRFVHDLTADDSQANDLANGLSGLVNGIHLTGIAKGVETQTQANILRGQGWKCAQGYYFGRPDSRPFMDSSADGRVIHLRRGHPG